MRTSVKEFARSQRAVFVRDETGSLTIFTLFLFILILFISGMAVDMVRHEKERVGLQNAIDTAVVAASSMTQDKTTDAEITALVKEYVAKAGYDPDMVTVTPDLDRTTGTVTSRSVTANVDFNMDTMFMNMMGIDTLKGQAVTAAREGQQLIEIAMVLDVSGSMGNNSKLENLKTAAKNFVTEVINRNGQDRVSISIIPYNQQVYMDDALVGYLTNPTTPSGMFPTTTQVELESLTRSVVNPNANPNAIASYETLDPNARCARFYDEDYTTRQLGEAGTFEASAVFSEQSIGMNAPTGNQLWCGENYPRMLLYQNNATVLHTHIDGLTANGWTSVDYGMNWGVGVLDPSFAPVVSAMVANGESPATMAGHPVAYSNGEVLKYVILMTDGINTVHSDLKADFKSGPSRIWHSQTLQGTGDEYAGFLVEMPGSPAAQRWFIPGDPTTTADDSYLHVNSFDTLYRSDAMQWDYHALYNRFSVETVANYFFGNSGDVAAFNEHWNAVEDSGGYGTADTRTRSICGTATADADNDGFNDIEVFTVAFEAPQAAQTLLADCAAKSGNTFVAVGSEIDSAFMAIAAQISPLRLSQ